jgi:hypothetical protein
MQPLLLAFATGDPHLETGRPAERGNFAGTQLADLAAT